MPSHSHQYEKFCHEGVVSFDAPGGSYRIFPYNMSERKDSLRFLYTYTTTNVGGGCSHNNMPPFLTANCWKRTG